MTTPLTFTVESFQRLSKMEVSSLFPKQEVEKLMDVIWQLAIGIDRDLFGDVAPAASARQAFRWLARPAPESS